MRLSVCVCVRPHMCIHACESDLWRESNVMQIRLCTGAMFQI